MSSVGYYSRPQYRYDVEHPTTTVVIATEVQKDGASTERKFTYGVDSEITKMAAPTITGGESYLFTMPPVTDGLWSVSAKSDFGCCVQVDQFRVELPDNSLLYTVAP